MAPSPPAGLVLWTTHATATCATNPNHFLEYLQWSQTPRRLPATKTMVPLSALQTLRPESLHLVAGSRAGLDLAQRSSPAPELSVDRRHCTLVAESRTENGSKGTTGRSCRNASTGTNGQGA